MNRNPILEELYAIRAKLLADAGGDMKKLLAGVREREAASSRLLMPTRQPRDACSEVTNPDELTTTEIVNSAH